MARNELYEFVRPIGRGGMATVELWRHRYPELLIEKRQKSKYHIQKAEDLDLVVAKRVYIGDCSRQEEARSRKEVQVLKQMEHPHIIKYFYSWTNREYKDLVIITEYCDGGDMAGFIKERQVQNLKPSPMMLIRLFAQVVHALQYSHQAVKMLHRDLKPSNIFLSNGNTIATLGDFGIATNLKSTRSMHSTFIGTQSYMSPEALKMQRYGLKCDVWSLGVTLYEALMLVRPFNFTDPFAVIQAIVGPEPAPPFPSDSDCPPELEKLIFRMLEKQPDSRPSLCQLLLECTMLREAVIQVEKDAGWPEDDSLLPVIDPNDQQPSIQGHHITEELNEDAPGGDSADTVDGNDVIIGNSTLAVENGQQRKGGVPPSIEAAAIDSDYGRVQTPQGSFGPAPLVLGSAFAGRQKRTSIVAGLIASGAQPPPPSADAPGRWGATSGLRRAQSPPSSLEIATEVEKTKRASLKTIEAFQAALGTPTIKREKLGEVLQRLNPNLSDKDLDALFQNVEQSEDGKIDYAEFVKNLVAETPLAVAARTKKGEPKDVRDDLREHSLSLDTSLLSTAGRNAVAIVRAAIREADQIRSLTELTMRRDELEEVLAVLPKVTAESDEPGTVPSVSQEPGKETASGDEEARIRRMGVGELKQVITRGGLTFEDCVEKTDLQERALQALQKRGSHGVTALESPSDDEDVEHTAALITTRLKCVAVLQSPKPDPVELNSTLREVRELELGSEECGVALLLHTHRLRMKAETVLTRRNSCLEDIEHAAEMLEAVQQEEDVPKESLFEATQQMQRVYAKEKKIGLRTVCGPSMRLLSVFRDSPFQDVLKEIAKRWSRPMQGLQLQWRDGGAVGALHTEEHWRRCVDVHPVGPIEILIPIPAPMSRKPMSKHRKIK